MTMNEPITPALTPEEWRDPPDVYPLCAEWDGHEHAIAALALHGQPFGFTWDDVDQLRRAAGASAFTIDVDALNALADRIAALLPPRKT